MNGPKLFVAAWVAVIIALPAPIMDTTSLTILTTAIFELVIVKGLVLVVLGGVSLNVGSPTVFVAGTTN